MLRLKRIKYPIKPEDICPGFSFSEEGEDRKLFLIYPEGRVLARTYSDYKDDFVELSYYVSGSVKDIENTFNSVDGSPLFAKFNRQ